MSGKIEVVTPPGFESGGKYVEGLAVEKQSSCVYIGTVEIDHDESIFWTNKIKIFKSEVEPLIEKLQEVVR